MHKREGKDALVDLRTVRINTGLPTEERIRSFIRQVKDPYHYKVGEVTVHVSYSPGGMTLDECFTGMISSM